MDSSAKAQLLAKVIHQLVDRYVDSVSSDELYDVAVRAVVKHLEDPYTTLLTQQAASSWNGKFGGIRVTVDVRDSIRVTFLYPDSPAAKADIRPGDRIVEMAGKSTVGWKLGQVTDALRGEVGSPLTMRLRRTGVAQPIDVTLIRAKIEILSVQSGVLLADSIGYLAFDLVTRNTAEQVRGQVAALRAKGMRALILDLRNNLGGDVNQILRIADLFLDSARTITSIRERGMPTAQRFVDETPQAWPDLLILVLVGLRTASAAEMLTAALQENDRALVLGGATYGKGVGMSIQYFSDSTALQYTTLRWYTPTGRSVHRATNDTLPSTLATESTDSVVATRPLARTVGGRPLRVGKGIVPDALVPPAAAELALLKATNYDFNRLGGGVMAVAFDLTTLGAIKSEKFGITPEMRQAVYLRLRHGGRPLPPSVRKAVRPIIDRRLRYETVYRVFGPAAALQYDKEVLLAERLLRQAKSPQDLLRLPAASVTNGHTGAPPD